MKQAMAIFPYNWGKLIGKFPKQPMNNEGHIKRALAVRVSK